MKNTQTTSSAVLHNPHGHNLGRKAPTKVQEEGKLFENNLIKSHSIGPGKKSCFMMAGCVWSSCPIFCTFSASFKKNDVSGRRRFSLTSNGDAMDAPFFCATEKKHRMDTSRVWRALVILENFSLILILEKFWKNFSSFWNNCCAPDTAWPGNPFSLLHLLFPSFLCWNCFVYVK